MESRGKYPKQQPPPPPEMKDNDDDDELDDEDDDGHGATLCGSCGESYVVDEFWICCHICENWFHEGLNSMSKLILEAGGSVYSKDSLMHISDDVVDDIDFCMKLDKEESMFLFPGEDSYFLALFGLGLLFLNSPSYSTVDNFIHRGMNGMEKRREEESDSLELIYRKCYKQLRKTHLFDMPLRTAEMDPKDSEQNYP
ncbi:PHD finger protein ALFIN-LIKE 4-like protein [Tanacetum coccineum]